MPGASNPILLYDGVCGLCNRFVQFILRQDGRDRFRFASLQSTFAAQILARNNVTATDLDTFYVVTEPGQTTEHLLLRSDAVIYALRELGDGWRFIGHLGELIPPPLRDAAYNLVARNRYRLFGKLDSCQLPNTRIRAKFLDT